MHYSISCDIRREKTAFAASSFDKNTRRRHIVDCQLCSHAPQHSEMGVFTICWGVVGGARRARSGARACSGDHVAQLTGADPNHPGVGEVRLIWACS